MPIKKSKRVLLALVTAVGVIALTTGVAGCETFGENVNRSLRGVSATMTTYNQYGVKIDSVRGRSLKISRDSKFDSTDSDGSSNGDSQVLLISIGESHISHVGSSMIVAEDGLTEITGQLPESVTIANTERGRPWLNNIVESYRNFWRGKAKTIMVRSQDGSPLAVYAGDEVEIYATDVPKSTFFRIDKKYLLVYRCDYTVYDTDLL